MIWSWTQLIRKEIARISLDFEWSLTIESTDIWSSSTANLFSCTDQNMKLNIVWTNFYAHLIHSISPELLLFTSSVGCSSRVEVCNQHQNALEFLNNHYISVFMEFIRSSWN